MSFEEFTQLYPVSKTLRFELKPVGETADRLADFKSSYLKEMVGKDQQRAVDYQTVKGLIDDFHREYIQQKLSAPMNPKTGELYIAPEDFAVAFQNEYMALKADATNEEKRELWVDKQNQLRKQLVKAFTNNADLYKKELITRDIPVRLQANNQWQEYKSAVESFAKFTTYFSGFHENRENMYSEEAQGTAIAFRLMNENLPKFFANCLNYQDLCKTHKALTLTAPPETLSKLNITTVAEAFEPAYFANLLTQTGIDAYQELLGGVDDKAKKTEGLNQQINLYQQQLNSRKSEPQVRKQKLSKFTLLYKQILSDRESNSYIPEAFEDDKSLLQALKQYIETTTKSDGMIADMSAAVAQLDEADLQRVYIKGAELTNISQALFGHYGVIKAALDAYAVEVLYPSDKANPPKAIQEQRQKYIGSVVFSVQALDQVLTRFIGQIEADDELHEQLNALVKPQQPILSYCLTAIDQAKQTGELAEQLESVAPLLDLERLNKKRIPPAEDGEQGNEGFQQVQTLQKTINAFMEIVHALKPLHLVKGRNPIDMPDVDSNFYADFAETYEAYSQDTVALYNKSRNHLTKQLYSTDKIKINFDAPTLLSGWDANKETDNASLLFEKDGLYYLGIMHPKHKRLFDTVIGIDDIGNDKKTAKKNALYEQITDTEEQGYRKVVYKLLPGANKMLPKVFFSKSRKNYFAPSTEIEDIRNSASHSKHGTPQKEHKKAAFSLRDCHSMIQFYKQSIERHPEWRQFNFAFSPTQQYEDLSGFYREVEQQGYRLDFHHIKDSYIDQCVAEGKLFLFQIYNKDFSEHSKGTPNLHTLYWKGIFSPENLRDVVIKLDGGAEIFYRKHSIKRTEVIKHDAGEPIKNKNHNNPKPTSTFDYDIIKDRRYTRDKFFFHVPIKLNFKAEGITKFNDKVNSTVAAMDKPVIIGIDRGERHLLYYSVIDADGNILDQGSLNTIHSGQNGKDHIVDYQQKLTQKQKERDVARKSWSSMENIKDLKSGYLSHVVHKLALLIVKHQAIICMEDLNFGFKRGRFKVEKQVYQKFEKALIDKLNYLVFKDKKDFSEAGHFANAYQLTAPFKSFKELGKQTGIIYYVPAAYTSKICFKTGFVNFVDARYQSVEVSQKLFAKFDSIRYNPQKQYFEFAFDYRKVCPDRKLANANTKWTACSHAENYIQNSKNAHGNWEGKRIAVTKELEQCLQEVGIEYDGGQDIKNAICQQTRKDFFIRFQKLLSLVLSLRHSISGTEEDYLISPVADSNGRFYNSEQATDKQPQDADANGAYHIALKGAWAVEQIKAVDWTAEKPPKVNLAMTNEQWFAYAQQIAKRRKET